MDANNENDTDVNNETEIKTNDDEAKETSENDNDNNNNNNQGNNDQKTEGNENKGDNGKKNQTNYSVENLNPDEIEYYVHYIGQDRRLDEWVKLDKFILSTLERAEKETEHSADETRRLRRQTGAGNHQGISNNSNHGLSNDHGDTANHNHHHSTQHGGGEDSAEAMLSGGNWCGSVLSKSMFVSQTILGS